ncbi:hypothetical protein DZC75_10495 [Pseudomonas parafulva]|uniref:Uncharacterized protein n=1 Tax=Pseudomonas parafulva TaxID=157782 RepID=A0AAI8KAN8_9PSED|nr:hypothetical protein [Pseudomonas parafulva]AXO88405.1 hypothetical protein DZC75_10495 [Pseudomonas parafulva]
MVFFADETRKRVMNDALYNMKNLLNRLDDQSSKKFKFLLEFVIMTLTYMVNDPELFDRNCSVNIEQVGNKLFSDLESGTMDEVDLEYIFSICYRLLIELQLSSTEQLSSRAIEAIEKIPNFTYGPAASQIRYAEKQMIINVAQHYIHHPALVTLKNLPEVIEQANNQHETFEKSLSEREDRVRALAGELDRYETAFNFVGLYAGFKDMRNGKVFERRINFFYLIILGLTLLLPFGIKILDILKGLDGLKLDAVNMATLAGLEILLLYFFRVALQNFRSIKAQLIQIDLRMTLCQFVQNYAEYSKSIRASNSTVLDRFEQIVFSGIVNDESAIPSTFDGLDKVADLLSKLRK